MPMRKSLSKKSVKTGANSAPDSFVAGARREAINPGPSKQAIERIERFERSSLRAEQRLGLTRLA